MAMHSHCGQQEICHTYFGSVNRNDKHAVCGPECTNNQCQKCVDEFTVVKFNIFKKLMNYVKT
jgi:hypothetical protein